MVSYFKDFVYSYILVPINNSHPLFIKGITLLITIFLFSGFNQSYSQTTVFFDNFESGTSNWTLQTSWQLTNSKSYSASNSLTTANSSGTYLADQNISATLTNGVDLSSYKGAEIDFYGQYDVEQYFDYVYLEISIDNGTTWYKVSSFTGTQSSWNLYQIDIGSFAGYPNVKVRFRLKSDQYVQYAGMYVDDFKIIGTTTDNSAPFIVVQSPQFYQGTQGAETINAQIFDVTGIQSASLYYNVDGVGQSSLAPSSVSGNDYTFTIPSQTPGSFVYFKIGATDSSPANNTSDTTNVQANSYISGTYLSYDNGAVDAVSSFTSSGGNSGAAVKITAPSGSNATLVSALIRNYKDPNTTNSQMLFHVWADNAGKPGTDLITPFLVTPAAALSNPSAMTLVDLRSYSSQLSNLNGDFYLGFTVPSGSVSIIKSNTVTGNRSYNYNGTTWSAISTLDYEFRAVIQDNSAAPVELFSFTAELVNSSVELKWSTATEVNNYGFDVERNSGNGWGKIGFVAGHGNSNSPKNYTFIDNSITNANGLQYRLRQIDNNGDFEYSNKVQVTSVSSNSELSQNFPNPFNPTTSIRYYISKNSFVKLTVYDMLGREVRSLVSGIKDQGNYSVEFNGNNLPSGVYMYRLVISPTDGSKGFVAVKKLMLVK